MELGYRVHHEIREICIEISRGNKIVVERQVQVDSGVYGGCIRGLRWPKNNLEN